MKLKQLLSNQFAKKHLSYEEKKYFKILDDCVAYMFPEQDAINLNLTKLIIKGQPKQTESMDNMYPYLLPMHVRDDAWMVNYVYASSIFLQTEFLNDKKSLKLIYQIPHDIIAKYIASSPKFEHYRARYEQNVVKGCILYNQIEDSKLRSLDTTMYEDFFRSKVVYTALQLGINRDAIEACLELNADMWRKKAMYIAFATELKLKFPNLLNDSQREYLHDHDLDTWEALVGRELKYMHLWVRKRENEYYRNHKTVIDKLGTATPNMQLDPLSAHTLYLDVNKEAKKYGDALSVANERVGEIQEYGL